MSLAEPRARPGQIDVPGPGPRGGQPTRWIVETAVVAAAVLAGVVLRAFAGSALWFDEALSVNIARLPLPEMIEALSHDGHPPLYYAMLHGWMEVFGQSDMAVRSLSGCLSIATLPLIWRVGTSIAGRRGGVAALVLMTTSPQAVRYATETRMYALVVLLSTAGWLAVRAAQRDPSFPRLAVVTAISGALLYTHYWCAYLVGATTVLLIWAGWRGRSENRRAARRVLAAVMGGVVLFLPWLPVLFKQMTSTGAPWAAPARPAQVAFSLLAGNDLTGEAEMLAVLLGLLAVLALVARPVGDHYIEIDVRTRPEVRGEWMLMILVLSFGVVGGYVGAVAFAARYTAVVLPVVLVLAAVGIAKLPNRQVRIGVVAVVAALGLAASLHTSLTSRTQVRQVANVLASQAEPGDVVVSCPDQLAPGLIRYTPNGFTHLTYPESDTPDRVNWVHYQYRVERDDPLAFAAQIHERGGDRPVWVVWSEGYSLLGTRCEQLVTRLGGLRPHDIVITAAGEGERAWLYRFDPPS